MAMVVVLLLIRAVSLGLYPLTDNTEARYGEIARRMSERSDWVTPWFTDVVPFWGKPPLSFWLSAGAFKLFGVGEIAARSPHYLIACCVLALVWREARRVSSRQAWHALTLLAGSVGFFVANGAVMTDMALTLGITLTMLGAARLLGIGAPSASRGTVALGSGVAIALLAKGPVGLVLAAIALIIWGVAARPRGRGFAWSWLSAALVALALAAPWYVLAEAKTPGFLAYFLIGEHWHRFLTPGWKGDLYGSAHSFPRGSIWLFALAATLPWPPLIAVLAWQARRSAAFHTDAPLAPSELSSWWLAFGLAPLMLFTVAGNILWTYVLPGLPGLALWLASWTSRQRNSVAVDRTLASGVALTVLIAAASLTFVLFTGRLDDRSARAVVSTARDAGRVGEPLYFLAPMPYSAAFYSEGRALEIAALNDLEGSRSFETALVVMSDSAFTRLDAAATVRVTRLATVGRWVIGRWHSLVGSGRALTSRCVAAGRGNGPLQTPRGDRRCMSQTR